MRRYWAEIRRQRRSILLLAAAMLGVGVVDELVNVWVRAVAPYNRSVWAIHGVMLILRHQHVMDLGHTLALAAVVVLGPVALGMCWRTMALPRALFAGAALMLGGGLANLFEAVALGGVTDYVFMPPWVTSGRHELYNLADAGIDIGVVLAVASLALTLGRAWRARQTRHRSLSSGSRHETA